MTVPDAPLPLLEGALLWSMRAWVIGHCRNVDVAARIGEVFDHLHALEAADHLDNFMHALRQGATRTLEVNCVCNPDVSADESTLLDVHALHQMGCDGEAHALLRRMTAREAAIAGCGHSARLAAALVAAGHSLPRATGAMRRHAFLHYATAGAASTSMHLH